MAEVVFFSNYLNHHQLSFCEELVKLTDNNFHFVAQKAISEKRIAFGYRKYDHFISRIFLIRGIIKG